MNEQYLQGFYEAYIKPTRPDVTYQDWVNKIKDNEEYKTGMFNTYVKPAKADAAYEEWNSKIFGGATATQPTSFLEGVSNAFERGLATRDVAEVLNPHEVGSAATSPEQLAKLQQAVATQEANPGSQAYQEFAGAKTFGEGFEALAKDPINILGELTVESLVPLLTHGATRIAGGAATGAAIGSVVPGLGTAAGAGVGAIGGVGSTSLNLEYASSILDALKDAGVNFKSMDSMVDGLQDEERMKEARRHALLKGVPIAAFDMFSAGIAGRLFSTPAKGLVTKALRGAAELGVQSTLGGAGELAGQIMSGEEIQPGAILAEAVGEFGGAPLEIATGAAAAGKKQAAPEVVKTDADDAHATGDMIVDTKIDQFYAKMAQDLDKIADDDVKDAAGIFSPVQQDINLKEDVEFGELDRYLEGLANNLITTPSSQEQELMLEDEQTPALAARGNLAPPGINDENEIINNAEQFTPQGAAAIQLGATKPSMLNDENEILDNTQVFTPEEAASLQASVLPSQSTQIEDAEAVGEGIGFPKPKAETKKTTKTKKEPKAVEPKKEMYWVVGNLTNGYKVTKQHPPGRNIREPFETEEAAQRYIANEISSNSAFKEEQKARKEAERATTPTKAEPTADELAKARNAKEERESEARERVKLKLNKFFESAKKRKPGEKLKRLRELDEMTMNDPELNAKIAKELDKMENALVDKEFEKAARNATTEEKLDMISTRMGEYKQPEIEEKVNKLKEALETAEAEPEKAEEIYNSVAEGLEDQPGLLTIEQAEILRAKKEVKAKIDKTMEPIRKEKAKAVEKETAQKKEKGDKRDALLTKVAISLAKNVPSQVNLDVQEFLDWRKSAGYEKPMSKEDVIKKAQAEFYERKANTAIVREEEQARAQERYDREKAKKESEDKIRKRFNLSDDAKIDFMFGDYAFEQTNFELDLIESFGNISEITPKQFFDKIKMMYPEPIVNALKSLFELSQKISKKFAIGGLEIYQGDKTEGGARGFHSYDPMSGREILFTNRKSNGDTEAHELIHFAVRAMIHNMSVLKYGNIKRSGELSETMAAWDDFDGKVGKIFTNAKKTYKDTLLTIARKLDERGHFSLTRHEQDFLDSFISYHDTRGITPDKFGSVRDMLIAAYDNFYKTKAKEQGLKVGAISYMFADSDEMLAESFSNPFSMALMSVMGDNNTVTSKATSFFRQLVDALRDFLKKLGLKIHPVSGNYMEQITSLMESMERQFLTEQDKPISDEAISAMDRIRRGAANLFRRSRASLQTAGPKLNKLTPALRAIIDKVANKLWKNENIKTVNDVERVLAKINKLTKGKTKLGQVEANLIFKKISKYRDELRDAKLNQKIALAHAKGLPEWNTSRTFKRDMEDFAAVDLDKLRRSQIQILETGILELATGGIPNKKAFDIANRDKATKYLTKLLPTAGKYVQDPSLFAVPLKYLSNSATFATLLSKYNKPIAQQLFNIIYGGMLEARTWSQLEANRFSEKLFKIAHKYSLTQKDYARAHMFGVAFTTVSDPTGPNYWTEVEANLDTIIQNSHNKILAVKTKVYKQIKLSTAQEELAVAQELKNTIMKNKTMSGVLTKPQQLLYDEFRKFITDHEADVERNSVGVWGDKNFHKFKNYMPTKALGRARDGEFSGDDELVPNTHSQNMWKQINKYGKVTSKQNGATLERTEPKGHFYDYNIMSVADKYAAPLLFDVYATRELKTLNHLLNGVQGTPIRVGKKDIYDVMSAQAIKGLNYQLQNITGQRSNAGVETPRLFKWLFDQKDRISTAMLTTQGQFIVQASSAIPAALIMSPKGFLPAMKLLTGFEKGIGNFKVVREFLEKNGLSIQIRDYLFERFDVVEYEPARGFAKYLPGGKVDTANGYALRKGDKFAARAVWFAAFFDAGGTMEKPTREAALAGERAVGLLQNMSDITFAAPLFKADTIAHKMLLHMFFAFKSFALNAAVNTYYSARFAVSSGEARRVFLSNVGMAMAYHAAYLYLIKPMYGYISDQIFGDDADDEDDQKNYTDWDYIKQNSVYDLLIGQASPAVIDGLAKWGVSEYKKGRAAHEGEVFDPVMDSPLFLPKASKDIWKDAAGQYGDLTEIYMELADALFQSVGQNMDLLDDSSEEAQDLMMYQALQDAALLMRFLPLRADFAKLMREAEKKQRKLIDLSPSDMGEGEIDNTGTTFEEGQPASEEGVVYEE